MDDAELGSKSSRPRDAVNQLRVVLAEDHETVREGLRLLFETSGGIDVVQCVSDGLAAVEAAKALVPDVVVLDLSMPEMNGFAAAREIKAAAPTVAVVILTRHTEPAYVQELFAAGADGYVFKQSPFDELLRAVRAAASGGRYLDRAARAATIAAGGTAHRTRTGAVTERELAVLRLASLGTTNKDIATSLRIAVKTVEVHKSSAMRKLHLRDRVEMLRFAVAKGWLHDL